MPTTASFTWSGRKIQPAMFPETARSRPVAIKPAASATVEYARGTIMARVTATGKYAVYDNTQSDGTEVAVGILMYDVSVDTNGNVALTTTAGSAGEFGERTQNIGIWIAGYFYGADLKQSGTGSLDAGAMDDLRATFIDGDLTNGILKF